MVVHEYAFLLSCKSYKGMLNVLGGHNTPGLFVLYIRSKTSHKVQVLVKVKFRTGSQKKIRFVWEIGILPTRNL